MTGPKLVAEYFTYTPMDLAVMEEQAVEALYHAKRTRWKYRRELQQSLKDYETDCQIRALSSNPTPQPPSRPGEFHPEPLTEPDLNLSAYPARATHGRLPSSPDIEFLRLPVDSDQYG